MFTVSREILLKFDYILYLLYTLLDMFIRILSLSLVGVNHLTVSHWEFSLHLRRSDPF